MPSKRSPAKRRSGPPDTRDAVDQFMRELDHPLKPAIELLRSTILGSSPEIAEGIKWNSPSFYLKTSGAYFATINVHRRSRAEDCVLVILHLGARVRADSMPALVISDPDGLLEWLARDRCAVRFHDLKAVRAKQAAIQEIVRQWTRYTGAE